MKRLFAVAMFALCAAGPASAQSPDTILVNGKILTVDAQSSVREALAIRDGRIIALGTSPEMRKLAGPQTRVIDLQARTVIPGLIDSHLHAIRAALSFTTEVNWIGVRTLEEALGRVKDAARTMKPGSWLIVAGGWNQQQFKENRRPTQAELVAVAPENPVYIQLGYAWAMLTPLAHKTLSLNSEADLPAGGRFERDAAGAMTGAMTGPQPAIVGLFDKLPRPTFDEQVQGTKAFFRELNRLGITGVIDPSGNNMTGESYQAFFKVWRDKALTVRVAYSLGTQGSGKEFDEIKATTALLPMGLGDEMLQFNGIGERITGGMYNNDKPTQADTDEYYRIALMGRRARRHADPALESRRQRRPSAHHLRARQPARADRAAALVDRAPERCVRENPPKDEGAGCGVDCAGRHVFRRRSVPRLGWSRVRSPDTSCRHREKDWCHRWRRHRRTSRRLLQSFHSIAMVPRREDCRWRRAAGTRGNTRSRRGASPLHDRQRVVLARRRCARIARSGKAR